MRRGKDDYIGRCGVVMKSDGPPPGQALESPSGNIAWNAHAKRPIAPQIDAAQMLYDLDRAEG